jgi:crotonobetainyl-CoA:carnitine CoA-transferase CaiB-like acyl-CoA transferase
MAGALATMILADYGAEVIRIEPAGGDPMWSHPAYLLWNRGKKSVNLELLSREARDMALARLIRDADVLIESLRPGVADELGVGYAAVKATNPSLVYFSLSAFGERGPYRNLKAYDGIVNAKSGRMRDQVGHHKLRPIYRAVNDTSYHTAMFAVQGILAALRVVSLTGRGQWAGTSLLRGVTAPNNAWRRLDGEELPPDRYPGQTASGSHLRGDLVPDRHEADPMTAIPSQLCTECKDGRWIMHSHVQLDLFRAWIHAIGFDWIWDDPRFKGAPHVFPLAEDRIELNNLILARMREKTSKEWIDLYVANPDCAGEVMQTTQEALRHPQFIHNGHVVTLEDPRVGTITEVGPLVKMSETPAAIRVAAPLPGEHTLEVLAAPARRRSTVQMSGAKVERPLDGVLVLELGSWLAAPFGGALLADLGARVIKVEPLAGDPYRSMSTNDNMIRAMQGKQSIAVDLKTEDGRRILHGLVRQADALAHNFRPGVAPRLAVDYPTLRAIKPDLVYLYAGSYGSSGPNSLRAAFNPTMGAFTGNSVFQSGEGNIPIGDQSPDPIAGSAVATALMLGLAARWRTGRGQYLETTMINSIVYCNSDDALDYAGKPPRRNPDGLQLGLEATYRLYETKSGWVFFAAPYDEEFRTFCAVAGCEELASDPRFSTAGARYENRKVLGDALESVFKRLTAVEWESRLTRADVGCVRADGVGHKRFLYEDPHTTAIEFMVPTQHPVFAADGRDGKYSRHGPHIGFSETPCEAGKPFVVLGEHTITILRDLGYSSAEIRRLTESNVVKAAPDSVRAAEMTSAGRAS